jgi:hypothetical protein
MSTTRAYGARALAGGGVGAMDKIHGDRLNDQDKCFVATETAIYVYNLDEDSGTAEDIPKVIAPDTELDSGGTKRWHLLGALTDNQKGRVALANGIVQVGVTFDYPFDDTNFQVVVSLSNTVDALPSQYGMSVSDKTVTGFTVDFSGAMDSANYVLNWIATRDLII